MKIFEYLTVILVGVRPDIAIACGVVFVLLLLSCISLAKRNKLFYFSKKESWKKKDSEIIQ
jgi:hypothetical protein